MANKLRDEDLQLNIIVNGDKGKKELGDLEKSTRELTNRNKELRAEKERLIRAGKKESAEFKAATKEITENNRAIKANEARMTELRKEIGVTGLTMKQLRTEQTRLKRLMDSATPGTPQWKLYRAELDKVEAQMAKVRAGSQRMRLSIGSVADGFNRFAAMGATVVATLTGIVFSMKSFVSGMVDLDDQLADVMKTTGLTRDQVRLLYQDFKTLNTRTPRKELLLLAEEAGRLGKKSRQDVMDFVEVANQIKVALGDDLGGEAEVAIREVGKLTNIYRVGEQYGTEFKDSMLKVGSAINEVSANSNAQAPYLIEYLKRMGGVADQAKINAASIIGYGSALDQLGQREEMAATAVGKVIVDMFTDTAKYAEIAEMNVSDFSNLLKKDANEAFLTLLEGLNGNNEGFSVMAQKLDQLGLDGNRAVQVLSALASNTDKIREEQTLANEAMDQGVSLTNEYNIKNNNLAASVSKLSQYLHAKLINSTFLGWLEKTVGKMSEWVELPLSETLQNEQRELNELVAAVTNANNTQETRNTLISELQEAYPDFLENLDAEKVTNEELRDRLTEVNKQYENKILLAIKEEALQDNYKKRVDLKLDELDAIKQIAKYEEIANAAREKAAGESDPNKLRTLLSDEEITALNAMDLLPKKLENIRAQFTDLYDQESELNAAVEELRANLADPGTVTPDPGAGGSGGSGAGGGSSTPIDAFAALDQAHQERMDRLTIQYEKEAWTDQRFKAERLAAEMAYLQTKKALLEQAGKDTLSVEAQISTKSVDLQKELNAVLAEGDKELFEEIAADSKVIDEAANATIKTADAAIDSLKKSATQEEQIMKQREQTYLQFAQMIGQSFGDLMADSEATFGDYLKNTLLMALDAFHQWFLIEKAKAIITGISGGPLKIAAAIAKVAAMEIAYQGVRAVVAGNIGKSKGKKAGGYTGQAASDDQVMGVYHANEWFASAPAVRNPEVKQFLDVFDYYQRTGQISKLNTQTIMASIPVAGKMAQGGYSTPTAGSQQANLPQPYTTTPDPEFKALLQKLSKQLDEPIKASINKYGTNGLDEEIRSIEKFNTKVFKK